MPPTPFSSGPLPLTANSGGATKFTTASASSSAKSQTFPRDRRRVADGSEKDGGRRGGRKKKLFFEKEGGGLLTASTAMGEGKKKHEEEKERGRGKGDKKVAVERAGKKGRRGRKKLKCLCQPRGKEKKGRHRLWEREKGGVGKEKVVLQRRSFPLPFFRPSIRLPPLPSSLFQHRHFPATDLLHDRPPPPPPPPVISSVVGRRRWRWQQERDSDSSSLRRLRRHLRGWKLLMLSSGDWSRRGKKSKRERGSKILSREDFVFHGRSGLEKGRPFLDSFQSVVGCPSSAWTYRDISNSGSFSVEIFHHPPPRSQCASHSCPAC